MVRKCLLNFMISSTGIWGSTQDPPFCGGPRPGTGGWCHRGWPCGSIAGIWSDQVERKTTWNASFPQCTFTTLCFLLPGFSHLPLKRVLVEFTSSNPKLTFVFSYVVVMPKKRQALVEYEDMNGSSTAVTYAADNQVYIAGHPAFINYSTSQKISRPGDSDDSRSVNNVLLLTIMNPIYPITTVNTKTCVTVCLFTWRVEIRQLVCLIRDM